MNICAGIGCCFLSGILFQYSNTQLDRIANEKVRLLQNINSMNRVPPTNELVIVEMKVQDHTCGIVEVNKQTATPVIQKDPYINYNYNAIVDPKQTFMTVGHIETLKTELKFEVHKKWPMFQSFEAHNIVPHHDFKINAAFFGIVPNKSEIHHGNLMSNVLMHQYGINDSSLDSNTLYQYNFIPLYQKQVYFLGQLLNNNNNNTFFYKEMGTNPTSIVNKHFENEILGYEFGSVIGIGGFILSIAYAFL